MTVQKVCVVTGGRAEYGILHWVLSDLRDDPRFELQLVVTGSHLSVTHGRTVDEIRADGFEISREVPLDLAGDRGVDAARAAAGALAGCAEAFDALSPDLVLVLGDRYEILAAAQAAALVGVPLVHIAGGDVSGGAIDDALRGAITQLAHVHLTTNAEAAVRLRSLGIAGWRVHDVGSPALDHFRRGERMGREELEASLGRPLAARNLVVAFHPVTLQPDRGAGELVALLEALGSARRTHALWITGVNQDPGHVGATETIRRFAAEQVEGPGVSLHGSLGARRFHALVSLADALVGNSSSGLYEAPALGTWTVDVGQRQAGRLAGSTVLRVPAEREAIEQAIARAAEPFPGAPDHPYGDGRSAPRILELLAGLPDRGALLARD